LLIVEGALGEGSAWGLPTPLGLGLRPQPAAAGLVGWGGSAKAVWYVSGGHCIPLRILQHGIARQLLTALANDCGSNLVFS